MKKICQIISSVSTGDAIGNEILLMDNIFKKWGYVSEIYANFSSEDVKDRIKKIPDIRKNSPDIIVYHYSGIDTVYEELISLKSLKIFVYHNITPYHYFEGYDAKIASILKKARESLNKLSSIFDCAIAKSKFSAEELKQAGFKDVFVVPVFIDFSRYKIQPVNKEEHKSPCIIFVGRIAPNKMIHELIYIFNYYIRTVSGSGKLTVVGGYKGADTRVYHHTLQKIIKDLGLNNVFFTGKISDEKLAWYYSNSDIFMTMSEHEGFCVPLLEAMYFEIPIIACNSGAIGETLGDSGILINNKRDFSTIAELIQICIENKKFRERIILKQKERLKEFSLENTEEKMRVVMDKL